MHGSAYDNQTPTRGPEGEVDYLAKAAEQLAKVAEGIDDGERRCPGAYHEERKQLADQYAQLGAIQRGQMPAGLARVLFEQLNKNSR